MLWETSYLIWGTEWWDWCGTTQWRWRTSRTRGARDRTLWCRWPSGCSSGATARRLHWFPSICQEYAISRQIPCPGSARLWPRSGRWPWRVYDQCLPSGANHRSICLRHSPTDDLSSSYRHIRTPGRSGQMPCPCPGTRRGASCTPSRHSKMVPQVLQKIAQSPGVQVILIALLQPAASWFPELMDLAQEDPVPLFVEGQDLLTQDVCMGGGVTETRHFRPSNLHSWKLSGPFWEPRVIPGKLPTWCQDAYENLHNKCMNLIGQDSWRSVGRKDGKILESEVIISVPIWCTSSGTDYYPRRLFHIARLWLLCYVIGCTIWQPTRTSSYWSGLSGWNVRCNAESCPSGIFNWFYYHFVYISKWGRWGILGWRHSPKMADAQMFVPVSIGFGKTVLVPARFDYSAWQMCVRERKHSTSTCGISTSGTWLPGKESATDAGAWMDHGTGDCSLESDGTGAYVVSGAAAEALHPGLRKKPGGPAANVLFTGTAASEISWGAT